MTADQQNTKIVWIISPESEEPMKPVISPFLNKGWQPVYIRHFDDLVRNLRKYRDSSEAEAKTRPDLILLGGRIGSGLENIPVGNTWLFASINLWIKDGQEFSLAPFYPVENEGAPNLNTECLISSISDLSLSPKVKMVNILGDHPRQAIQDPQKMVELEIALGLRPAIGMEGPQASTIDPARR